MFNNVRTISVFHIKIDDEVLLKLDASLKWKHVFHNAKNSKLYFYNSNWKVMYPLHPDFILFEIKRICISGNLFTPQSTLLTSKDPKLNQKSCTILLVIKLTIHVI